MRLRLCVCMCIGYSRKDKDVCPGDEPGYVFVCGILGKVGVSYLLCI